MCTTYLRLNGRGLYVVVVGLGVVPEELPPLVRVVEAVGVVEGVPGLVAQVHEDLALRLRVAAQLRLDGVQPRVRQVERQADHRHPGRAAPLIGQVALRPERDALALQLRVELVDVALQGRALQVEPQVLDAGLEQRLALGTAGRVHRLVRVGEGLLAEGDLGGWSIGSPRGPPKSNGEPSGVNWPVSRKVQTPVTLGSLESKRLSPGGSKQLCRPRRGRRRTSPRHPTWGATRRWRCPACPGPAWWAWRLLGGRRAPASAGRSASRCHPHSDAEVERPLRILVARELERERVLLVARQHQ